jgi:hypothetical protein
MNCYPSKIYDLADSIAEEVYDIGFDEGSNRVDIENTSVKEFLDSKYNRNDNLTRYDAIALLIKDIIDQGPYAKMQLKETLEFHLGKDFLK